MEQRAIADTLKVQFPEEVLDIIEHHDQVGVLLRPDRIVPILRWLRDTDYLCMDHLRALCGVDNKRRQTSYSERFEVVYQLYSTSLRHGIRLRVLLPEEDAHVESAVSLWPGANWLEREVFDMFGIRFDNHPNMRRVLLPDDWVGHPLLKEYPLKGKKEWQGLVDLKKLARELDQHGFYPPPLADEKKTVPVKTVAKAVKAAVAVEPTDGTAPAEKMAKTLRERDQA
ncbi:MAG: NADH-quinone oxidoreductase subunit C [Desulfobulbaceae bacterium]|nr:NADH-quinone oxidoreductase subunit C [Desulfobulbaceae bacterium]